MSRADYKKVIITMPARMIEFLDSIGQKSRRTHGYKVANTEIVRALITASKKLKINFEGLKSEEELVARILEAAKAFK